MFVFSPSNFFKNILTTPLVIKNTRLKLALVIQTDCYSKTSDPYKHMYHITSYTNIVILAKGQYYNNQRIIFLLTNTTSVICKCGALSLFLSLVIILSVLPSNFIISAAKGWRYHLVLILNVILFEFC